MKLFHKNQNILKEISRLEAQQRLVADKQKLDDLFVLKRWVENYQTDIQLPFPSEVYLTEKPDFIITGEISVGIEVTKFLSEQRQRATVLANKNAVGHSPTQFDFDSPPRKNPEIEQMVKRDHSCSTIWREVNSTMDLYADKITSILTAKAHKVIKNSNHSCDRFILVIEDHHMISNIGRRELSRLLEPKIKKHFEGNNSFHEIWLTSLIDSDASLLWIRTPNH